MEEWKDIPGYEQLYQASSEGRIRSCEGKVTTSARFPHRVWKSRIMRLKYQNRKGTKGLADARIELWKDGQHKTWLVSRLVALTWCQGYKDGMTVNHKDGNPSNNNANNLEWVTLEENIKQAYDDGLYPVLGVTLISQDGKRTHFSSYEAAGRYIGASHGYIHQLMKKGKTHTFNGYKIEADKPCARRT